MNEKKLEQLRYAALLHDLGKIGIPDEVLNKPSELSNEEWAQVQEHPFIGAELIEKIHALKPVSKIVLQHHERWDGKGYPQGLQGESILAGARILSVVDAYDAMTTDRPYRQALSKKSAIDELRQGNGTQFDPDVVNAFLKLLLEI